MTSSYSHIIIDQLNLYFRNYFTHKEMTQEFEGTQIPTGGIYGFIKSLQKLQKEHGTKDTIFHIATDNFSSRDLTRRELDPDYKINRIKYEDSIYKAIELLSLILMNYSDKVILYQVPKAEADDLPPMILSKIDKYEKVLVVSNDLDYSRCISKNVHWSANNVIYDEEAFKNKYNFSPSVNKVILYKVFRGDSSDNIPIGVKGIREEILLKLMDNYKDIYEILDNLRVIDYLGKYKEDILKNQSRLILNHQLISFIEFNYDDCLDHIHQGKFSPIILRSMYKALGFNISQLDERLMGVFPTKEEIDNSTDFFTYDKIGRL